MTAASSGYSTLPVKCDAEDDSEDDTVNESFSRLMHLEMLRSRLSRVASHL